MRIYAKTIHGIIWSALLASCQPAERGSPVKVAAESDPDPAVLAPAARVDPVVTTASDDPAHGPAPAAADDTPTPPVRTGFTQRVNAVAGDTATAQEVPADVRGDEPKTVEELLMQLESAAGAAGTPGRGPPPIVQPRGGPPADAVSPGGDPRRILVDLPLRAALDRFRRPDGERVRVDGEVPGYLLSIDSVKTVDGPEFYRVFDRWAMLRGLEIFEGEEGHPVLRRARQGIPGFAKQADEPVGTRLRLTLESLPAGGVGQKLELVNLDVHGVLDLVQRTAHKPVVRGTLPRAECSFLDRDLTPLDILVEMDRLLLEKGIVLMESGPDYILAASVSPIEFGESARPPAARISRPVIRPPAERGREGP